LAFTGLRAERKRKAVRGAVNKTIRGETTTSFFFTGKPFSSLSQKKTTQPGQPNGCRMVGVHFSSPTRRVADFAVGEQARVRKLAQRERIKKPKRN
jgi:hypothetical protein